MLVQTAECDMISYLSTNRGTTTADERVRIFQRKMLHGDIRGAVKYLTNSEVGGVLMPSDTDAKSGKPVEEALHEKHPNARPPPASMLPKFSMTPDLVDLNITNETVKAVGRKLSGSGGLGGTDAMSVRSWLLQFGGASRKFRTAVAYFGEWMSNGYPPWAAPIGH